MGTEVDLRSPCDFFTYLPDIPYTDYSFMTAVICEALKALL